jgi:hypothetical protein
MISALLDSLLTEADSRLQKLFRKSIETGDTSDIAAYRQALIRQKQTGEGKRASSLARRLKLTLLALLESTSVTTGKRRRKSRLGLRKVFDLIDRIQSGGASTDDLGVLPVALGKFLKKVDIRLHSRLTTMKGQKIPSYDDIIRNIKLAKSTTKRLVSVGRETAIVGGLRKWPLTDTAMEEFIAGVDNAFYGFREFQQEMHAYLAPMRASEKKQVGRLKSYARGFGKSRQALARLIRRNSRNAATEEDIMTIINAVSEGIWYWVYRMYRSGDPGEHLAAEFANSESWYEWYDVITHAEYFFGLSIDPAYFQRPVQL